MSFPIVEHSLDVWPLETLTHSAKAGIGIRNYMCHAHGLGNWISLAVHTGAWKVGPTISVGPGTRSGSESHKEAKRTVGPHRHSMTLPAAGVETYPGEDQLG